MLASLYTNSVISASSFHFAVSSNPNCLLNALLDELLVSLIGYLKHFLSTSDVHTFINKETESADSSFRSFHVIGLL